MSIKIGNNDISKIYLGSTEIEKIYQGDTAIYEGDEPTPPSPTAQQPCFAVVPDITAYTATTYEDVYDSTQEKWYKLNNLSQYEEYGVYDTTTATTYYEGKLIIDDADYVADSSGIRWVVKQYSGSTWEDVGTAIPNDCTVINFTFSGSSTYVSDYPCDAQLPHYLMSKDGIEMYVDGTPCVNATSPFSKPNFWTCEPFWEDSRSYSTVLYIAAYRNSQTRSTKEGIVYASNDTTLMPTEEYPEKSAPANNVVFSSMTEACAYECPWVGMTAIIDGVEYVLDASLHWIEQNNATVELGDDQGTGGI